MAVPREIVDRALAALAEDLPGLLAATTEDRGQLLHELAHGMAAASGREHTGYIIDSLAALDGSEGNPVHVSRSSRSDDRPGD
jgi:hypothetical protein